MKKKYLIVVADYYQEISRGLLNSALKEIPKLSIIKIIKVPGVFEIPVTISKTPGTLIIFIKLNFGIDFKALSRRPFEIFS